MNFVFDTELYPSNIMTIHIKLYVASIENKEIK